MSRNETSLPSVGDEHAPREFGPITPTDFVRYQGASGDFMAVHHDEAKARSAGFPTVFSVGMFQAGLLATYATDWLGVDSVRRYTMRFTEQCWPGDVLTCAGEVVTVEPEPDGGHRVGLALSCTRQTGGVALTATAEFVIADA